MENKKKISSIIAFVLMAIAAATIIYCLITQNKMPNYITFVIASIANLLAILFGLIYTAKGSTKDSAFWLKMFEGFVGLSLLSSTVRSTSIGGSTVAIVLNTLSFGLLCILCYAENLGKKRSLCIGGVLIASSVVEVIVALSSKMKLAKSVNLITKLVILIILVLLLINKYKDKETRGTK